MMILLSRKVKKENILDHLSMQRYLYENLLAYDRISWFCTSYIMLKKDGRQSKKDGSIGGTVI